MSVGLLSAVAAIPAVVPDSGTVVSIYGT